MNIIEEMIRYNLTLRRLNDRVISIYRLPSKPTSEELSHVQETVVVDFMDENKFKALKEKGLFTDCRWENGKVYRKFVVLSEPREEGWLVKQDYSHNSRQIWDRNKDFFGKTPEEAIRKAVEYYQKKE